MALTHEQWQEINSLFHEAIELKAGDRQTLLKKKASADIAAEVQSLLAAYDSSEDFLDSPVNTRIIVSTCEERAELLKTYTQGEEIGDFEIDRVLGQGSFATVYLSRQISLDRMVALKVSPNFGEEAKTMAHLEHDNIVKVYSQTVDPKKDIRLICMQYVAGTTLETIFKEHSKPENQGETFLQTLDRLSPPNTTFNPSALKDREELSGLDEVETILWLGKQLADALAYAHDRGVLHLDIKPGNILVNAYGRPLLTDFNVSLTKEKVERGDPTFFGGTLNYMAPEHQHVLDSPEKSKVIPHIDHRADIYSLGRLLWEALSDHLDASADIDFDRSSLEIRSILQRCLERDPQARFHSATELSKALNSCLKLRSIAKTMPPPGRLAKIAFQYPLTVLSSLILLPQIFATAVNITYNTLRVVSRLSEVQQVVFHQLVIYYNLFIYPVGIGIILVLAAPIVRFFTLQTQYYTPELADRLRSKILQLPLYIVSLSTFGWLLGGLVFPLVIDLKTGGVSPDIYLHFFISFALSWLIALTYSILYTEYIGFRVLYPQFCIGLPDIQATTKRELRSVPSRIQFFHFLSGMIPLVGAMILILVGPDNFDANPYQTIRVLGTILILVGIVGMLFAIKTSNTLSKAITALTGAEKTA